MKHFFIVLLLISNAFLLNAQTDKAPFQTKSLAGESVTDVKVETSGGNIAVSSVKSGGERVEVYISSNNNRDNLSKEEIQKRLNDDYDFSIAVANHKLIAIAKPKEGNMNWKKALNISFQIFVPQNVATDLSTSGGNIRLNNITGTQNFSTSGGNLYVEQMDGKMKGSTSGGNIYVKASKNDMDLSTSGGNIEATDCNGHIKLTTSGGSLKLDHLSGTIEAGTSGGNVHGSNIEGELSARTSGGNVQLADLSCSLETATTGGHMDIAIKQPGKYIKVSNSGGHIALQLPKNAGFDLNLHGKVKITTLNNFNGTTDEDNMKGTLNGGGTPVTVDAGGGKISLSFQ